MIKTLCIGEILWDIFPDKKVWGGAPANFIFHTAQFGADAACYSAIGQDTLGAEITEAVSDTGIKLIAPQLNKPTGKVDITLDGAGTANYTFNEDCAWDHLSLSPDLIRLSQEADLIAFGTLAQRNNVSAKTIHQALSLRKPNSKVLFDINLRLNFYSEEIISTSLNSTDFLKLNEDEIVIIEKLLNLSIKEIIQEFNLELVILTLGAQGSKIISKNNEYIQAATPCEVIDTVGAGDSFTASFIINYLNGIEIPEALEVASKVAAYVCGHHGATVSIPEHFKLITTKDL